MKQDYSPDILNCLANLSSDEVFTSPELANRMLDLLPQELFRSPKTRFLDPCSKSGVFLREIAKRLLAGLEAEIPDLQKRIDHIMTHQVFGIACTDLTAEMSRRTLYCSKLANGEYSVTSAFRDVQGNLRYDRCQHTWNAQGRCECCGASKGEYLRSDSRETYAYPFIHKSIKEIFHKDMQFDVIIGNPPYQMSIGGGGSTDRATPVYNKFVNTALKVKANYVCMIIPSKWMVGGFGLKEFRQQMSQERRLKVIVDFEDSASCFPGVHIDGGVCYFLIEDKYNGKTKYEFHSKDGTTHTDFRYLTNQHFDYIIRDGRILSLLDKVNQKEKFSKIVSAMNPFGVNTFLFNEPERMPEAQLSEKPYNDSVEVHGVYGIKGGAKRKVGYIKRNTVSQNVAWIDMCKIFFSCTYSTNAINYPEPIFAGPNVVCTGTFIVIGPFRNKEDQLNCKSYMETKFFKVLLYFGKGTMHVTRSVFGLIPLVDFSHPWTDEMLYKKYGLTEDEIAFIESMIRPME